jgi:hypothetical protein
MACRARGGENDGEDGIGGGADGAAEARYARYEGDGASIRSASPQRRSRL